MRVACVARVYIAKVTRLLLVRHGPSAYVPTSRTLTRRDVERWRVDYDAAGVLVDSAPPPALVVRAQSTDVLLTSTMRRAWESADRLAAGRAVVRTPLLRETPLPIPNWPTRLPLGVWGAIAYVAWKAGAPLPPEELVRVREAAAMLCSRVPAGATGLAVSHGVFRAMLADELERRGWRRGDRVGGYGHWSAWEFYLP